jgi:hypothetical protein
VLSPDLARRLFVGSGALVALLSFARFAALTQDAGQIVDYLGVALVCAIVLFAAFAVIDWGFRDNSR